MSHALARRLEMLADEFASVSLGGAFGLLVYHSLAPVTVQTLLSAYAAAAAAIFYATGRSLLGRVRRCARLVPVAPVVLEAALAAASADDHAGVSRNSEAELGSAPDAPVVVRLFDPAAASVPRQSTHLSPAAPPDASESLREALNQLRHSLR